ncbi:MAG TPA: RNA-binding protein, partial [Thermoplasmatales archaeon]|nr:RNA-binding protein [Thermoplasmatales archaeon]
MLKNRYVVRKKEARKIADDIRNIYGCEFPDNPKIERAKLLDFDVVLVDNSVDFLIHDDRILFILSSIEKYKPKKKFVTIDMGAIKFIAGGADVMVPGIVDADRDIR